MTPPPPGPATPPAAIALRVLSAGQAAAALAGAVQAGVFAAGAASRSTENTVEGWFQGLGAFVGTLSAFGALVTSVVLGLLSVGLRDRPYRRHVGVLVGLVIAEIVLLLPAAPLTYGALSSPVALDVAAVPTVVTAAALAVLVLAVLPVTRAWARGPVPPPGWPGPGAWAPGPAGPPGVWQHPGPWSPGPEPWEPGPSEPGPSEPWRPGPWRPGP